MGSVNKVILVGNLGAEPDVRYLQDNRPVVTLSIATTRSYKNQAGQRVDETEWHRVVFFARLAEICGQYLHKGSQIYVEGRLRTRKYEKDGITRYATEIMGESMTMLSSRQSAGQSDYPPSDNNGFSDFDNSSRPAPSRPTYNQPYSQPSSYTQPGSFTPPPQPRQSSPQSSPATPGTIPGDADFGMDEDIPF